MGHSKRNIVNFYHHRKKMGRELNETESVEMKLTEIRPAFDAKLERKEWEHDHPNPGHEKGITCMNWTHPDVKCINQLQRSHRFSR